MGSGESRCGAAGRPCAASPATIDSAQAKRSGTSPEEVRDASRRSIPAGRYGDPAEFGAVAAFLCSGPASYLTGEQIRCDGGYVDSY